MIKLACVNKRTAQFEHPPSWKHEILYPGSCLILKRYVSFVEGQTSLLQSAKESWVWRQHWLYGKESSGGTRKSPASCPRAVLGKKI